MPGLGGEGSAQQVYPAFSRLPYFLAYKTTFEIKKSLLRLARVRGGLLRKELVLPQKWGVVLYSNYSPKPMF